MRPRPPKPRLLVLLALIACCSTAQAQNAATNEGALFLLLPVGARASGMGQAVTAKSLEGESVWWNPSGLAGITRTEILLHHSQSLIGTGDALSVAVPFALLGVFSLSASTVNFGEQELGETPGGPTGILIPRSFVFAASYATVFTKWMRGGVTYKLVQSRADCSGACGNLESLASSTSAIDAGVQFSLGERIPIAIGAVVRNVGPRVQVVDNAQADELPSRIHLGVDYRVIGLEPSVKDTRLHISAELIDRLEVSRPSLRMGTELRYQEKFFLRGGYVFEEGGGPSIGGGLTAGRLVIDIGRILGGLSADIGSPPTFLSLRYRF